ncbi:MAG: HEAT repeat domain-containing protein, partial [Planctomycetota bacterium]
MRSLFALLAAASVAGCGGADESARAGEVTRAERTQPAFLSSKACASCHEGHAAAHAHSNHALAMQSATATTVLGDFDDATFEYEGVVTTFSRRGETFVVRTDDASGALQDFEVAFTFGVAPLQQYLVELGRGRLHALDIAWDTRGKEQGGQRWIHLHPTDKVRAGDPLHWTGENLQWNHMCAECHSTNLQKGYDAAADTFATTATEHGVGCEACHGPGERHVAWATGDASLRERDATKGLVVQLQKPAAFVFEAGARTAKRVSPASHAEVEACARCHSRRTTTTLDYEHGVPLLDTHLPTLLDDPLYFADGQIHDEVFEYGSFVQSKMFHSGVTCSDCHDAHAGGLRAKGNELCLRCHDRTYFDQPSHHHHAVGSAGASCVECHMPERHYMVVDPRRDHSIRVPRPDLSVAHGTENACSLCHADKSARWADDAVRSWRKNDAAPPSEHWTAAIASGRARSPNAKSLLLAALAHGDWPAIVRGTAASLLRDQQGDDVRTALAAAARDPEPLVRLGAIAGLSEREQELRARVLAPLLADERGSVRQAVAFALADCEALLPADLRAAFARAAREYD